MIRRFPTVLAVGLLCGLFAQATSAQLICEQDPDRVFVADDDGASCRAVGATTSGTRCGPGRGACGQLSGDEAACEAAFTVFDGRLTSCWYESQEEGCRPCGGDDVDSGRCFNACDPVTCLDPDRTLARVDNYRSPATTSGGEPPPNPGGCRMFDLDPSGCAGAYEIRTDDGFSTPLSCFYDEEADECLRCGNFESPRCTNECLPPPSCLDTSRTFAGGPGVGGCSQLTDEESCVGGFARDGFGADVSCYWEMATDDWATTSGEPRSQCRGCGAYPQAEGVCVNMCAPPPVCEQAPDRELVPIGPRNNESFEPDMNGCGQFESDPGTCDSSFRIDQNGNPISCFSGVICSPCGGGEGLAVGAVTSGISSPPFCLNDCIEPPACFDDSLTFLGGPGTSACRQFDGNQSSCESSYALSGSFGPVSCTYDEDNDECRGCNRNRFGPEDCTNKCEAPSPRKTCEDETHVLFMETLDSSGCGIYNGDETSCNMAYAQRRFGSEDVELVSCFYDSGSCRGCARNNEILRGCINTCNPPVCQLDQGKVFEGRGCSELSGQQSACEAAFVRVDREGANDEFTSCWYDSNNSACSQCAPEDALAGNCTNECQAPPPCPEDSGRTVFTGGPGTMACRNFDGDATGCAMAYARNFADIPVACFYDAGDDTCRGCSFENETTGRCSNTCTPTPECANSSRTILSDCRSIMDASSCEQSFTLGPSGPIACLAVPTCRGCTLSRQGSSTCSNECFAMGTGPGPDGVTCVDDSECSSGNCVNQICCDTPCDGPGEFCGQDGVCTSAPAAAVPATSPTGLIAALAALAVIAAFNLSRRRRQS